MQRIILFLILVCLLCPGRTLAQSTSPGSATCNSWISKIVSIQGIVEVNRNGGTRWQPTHLDDTFCPGDRIRVGANSRAAIVLVNEAVMRLDQRTTIVFQGVEAKKTFLLNLLEGAAHFFSRKARHLKVSTPFVNGVVKGTEFLVRVDNKQTRIDLFEGRIRTENQYGDLLLAKGQGALATAGSAPQRRILVQPRDSVQWALYYPPTLVLGPDEVPEPLQKSLRAFNQGRTIEAIDFLNQVKEANRDARFHSYRAALLLHQGRVFQARDDLQQAMVLDPDNSEALALTAVISVVQNRKEEALSAAQKAASRTPSSAASHLALSYVQQSLFHLPEALEAARTATARAPENGTAWARLAELYLSSGALDRGIQAARKAAELNPHAAHAHTILGFAYLTQFRTDVARDAFDKAIALDSAAPLPRLGLGLAKIRDGDLKQGRAEIEIAAGLDPLNAMIRSYLGKAYFDEKREPLDATQLEIAKTLDPNDPTPWFYDAIRKQALNRPVEALQDLHRTIALNDSRAVYRSRFMLDDDLGARSASLGRIYNELGFQQLALIEGWKSVNYDPSNHSAHRFLSDSYAVLPRHEVARISELLQSQLLQPLNMTPVQPQLSESTFFILEGSGPAEPSLNEFNPLFHRNRNSLLASGVIGENGIRGDELVFTGLWQNVSYGVGQSHYETDGFRKNNDMNRDTYNVFLQASLTNKTSIMTEGRYTESEQGDLPLRFPIDGQDNFSSNLRQDRDDKSIRLGIKQAFSPRSQIISHFTYVSGDENYQDVWGADRVEFILDDTGYMAEGQYLWSGSRFRFAGGLGYFERDREDTTIYFGEETTKLELTHTNYYVYSYLSYPDKFTWTVGGSVDIFKDDATTDRDQFNPKFGLLITPFGGTSIRAAAFRTVKRSLAGQQTIEPTQVAGFNQFYDDINGASSWRYGLAVDQTFSPQFHGGIEYSTRDIDSPSFDIITFEIVDSDWNESLTRAYLYWTPNALFAASAEYLFEEFNRDDYDTGIEAVKELKTQRFPLGVNYFHPNGLSASLKCTYIIQEGIFGTEPADFREGEDDFWLFDVGARYRLPNRVGLISVGVRNLFDSDFNFQDMDLANQTIFPERIIYAKVTFSF